MIWQGKGLIASLVVVQSIPIIYQSSPPFLFWRGDREKRKKSGYEALKRVGRGVVET